jgi:hypothetical protein
LVKNDVNHDDFKPTGPATTKRSAEAVEAPLVALGTDAGERRGIGKQRKLNRVGHRARSVMWA